MKKYLLILFTVISFLSCKKQEIKITEDSPFVKEAKLSLNDKLESTFKKGTYPKNLEILYLNEQDSICIFGFDCKVTRASGRIMSGECEYVYYPKGYLSTDGVILYLDKDRSIIEQAKDFADEVELDTPPEERDKLGGWEESMKFVVPLVVIKKGLEK